MVQCQCPQKTQTKATQSPHPFALLCLIQLLATGLQQLAQIKEVASEISNNPLDGVDSAHLTTQKELQQKIIELQYTDEDEPLEIDRKIREQLMAFKAFNSYQAKMITDVSGLLLSHSSGFLCSSV